MKSDELMDDGTGKPVVCPQARTHEFQSRFSREHKRVMFEENHDKTVKHVVCPQGGQGHRNSSLETTKNF